MTENNIELLIHIADLITEHRERKEKGDQVSADITSWIHNQTGYEINFISDAIKLLQRKGCRLEKTKEQTP